MSSVYEQLLVRLPVNNAAIQNPVTIDTVLSILMMVGKDTQNDEVLRWTLHAMDHRADLQAIIIQHSTEFNEYVITAKGGLPFHNSVLHCRKSL